MVSGMMPRTIKIAILSTYVVLTKVRNGLVRRIIQTLHIHDLPVSLKEVHMYNTIFIKMHHKRLQKIVNTLYTK